MNTVARPCRLIRLPLVVQSFVDSDDSTRSTSKIAVRVQNVNFGHWDVTTVAILGAQKLDEFISLLQNLLSLFAHLKLIITIILLS